MIWLISFLSPKIADLIGALCKSMKSLYPEISPFHSFMLETESVHKVYVEQCGNPAGIPVVFLHGGPCSGTKPDHRRFFDPERYHVILMDQRGCGRSLPFGELADNTTQHLLRDLERIRDLLRIDKWLLFGGSWGATLALLYAQQFTERVAGMILRGVFLARAADMDWFLLNGANKIYPQQWRALVDRLGAADGADILPKLCAAVFGDDVDACRSAVRLWNSWGGLLALGAEFQESDVSDAMVDERAVMQAKMELHYARNHYFVEEDRILRNCGVLAGIPTVIIHGQNDLTCPMEAGYRLYRALPQAEYVVLPNAGHVAKGEEMIDALVTAADRMVWRCV